MIWYYIQQYINNKWQPFCREARYGNRNVAEDIYIELCSKYSNDRFRIVVKCGREIVDIYY